MLSIWLNLQSASMGPAEDVCCNHSLEPSCSHAVAALTPVQNARDPVDLDLPNSAGLSIRDILQQQQQHQGQYDPAPGHPGDADSSRESPTRSGSSEEGRGWHNGHGSSRVMGASAEHQASDAAAAAVADDEWNARLADEMSDDEGGWGK